MAQHGTLTYAARDQDETAGDRPCSRGPWCAEATRELTEDGKYERKPVMTWRAFCESDRAIIGDCVRAMPATYERLCRALLERVTGEVLVRIPFGPSVPLRVDVDEIMRLIVDAAMTWHERVGRVARLSAPDSARWRAMSLGPLAAALLGPSCAVLGAHLDVMLGLEPEPMLRPSASPAARAAFGAAVFSVIGDTTLADAGGAQAGLEFQRLDYLARAAMGETAPQVTRLLGVVCANTQCSRMALRLADPPQHEGDTAYLSQCMSCRHLMTEQEYTMWARRNARYWAARLTPAQVAARSDLSEGAVARLAEVVLGTPVATVAAAAARA